MHRLSLVAYLTIVSVACCQSTLPPSGSETTPQLRMAVFDTRVGVKAETEIALQDVIERVLVNDTELQVARLLLGEQNLRIRGALGYFDPVFGLDGYKSRAVTPIASLIGGSASGRLTFNELTLRPELTGSSPWLGTTYHLSFSDSRQTSDSTFNILNPQYPASLTLDLRQPLRRGLRYDGGRHALQVARKNGQLSMEQLRQRISERVTLAVQYYWELCFSWQNLRLQAEAVRLSVQQFESNRKQVEQHTLAPVSVVEAQAQVAYAQQGEASARQMLTLAENSLKQVMTFGREDPWWSTALVPGTRPATEVTIPPLDVAVKAALASRPELSVSDLGLAVNALDQKLFQSQQQARVDAYATISTSGLAGTQQPMPMMFPGFPVGSLPAVLIGDNSQALHNVWSGKFPSVKLGVQVSLPFRNRAAQADAAVSVSAGRRLQVQRRQTEMMIEADVRNALEQLGSARARFEAAGVARQAAEEQFTTEKRQFEAGSSTMFLVFQRQSMFIAARSGEERALTDLGIAEANLDRAMGRTIETHQIRVTP